VVFGAFDELRDPFDVCFEGRRDVCKGTIRPRDCFRASWLASSQEVKMRWKIAKELAVMSREDIMCLLAPMLMSSLFFRCKSAG
jgi:hypothetical protein